MSNNKKIEGILSLNSKGDGYLITEDGSPDVFVHKKNLHTAMHNDRVIACVFSTRDAEKPEGEVMSVIERCKTKITGVLDIKSDFALVMPDDRRVYMPLVLDPSELAGAEDGDKVVVEITGWDEDTESPTLALIDVLGKPGEHNTEMNAIVLEYGFDTSFPEEVERQAHAIKFDMDETELSKRRDFRSVLTFTIDPADAKDFDDAISFVALPNGRYEVGVHIADVSHYVPEGSALDNEAYHRATSVYLVDRTIPMLPEVLSNGVCSLRPNEDKLTFSAVFEMDDSGKVYRQWFGKTVTHSSRRFTYEEAQERIESREGDLWRELETLNVIARALKAKRFESGAINFESDEVRFDLSEDGTPTGISIKTRKDAHKLVEEFMLLANRRIAQFIATKKPGLAFVYRSHESPTPDKISVFNRAARRFGYRIEVGSPKAINRSYGRIAHRSAGKPEQKIVQQMAIRTMSKAIYTTKKSGHYGLAFDYYTHFTSPIRRYADVMVHRLLQHYLERGKSRSISSYEAKCKHSTQREIQAAEAERASVKYKQVEFLKDKIGSTYDGVITGVTEWGMYIEIAKNGCEGMVRLTDIPGDFYVFDEKNYRIIGKRKKRKFEVGQQVRVQLTGADVIKRQLDFKLAK